jgi:hypothetical protein
MYLNYKQADSKLFFISLHEIYRIINKKAIYLNIIFIIIMEKKYPAF